MHCTGGQQRRDGWRACLQGALVAQHNQLAAVAHSSLHLRFKEREGRGKREEGEGWHERQPAQGCAGFPCQPTVIKCQASRP
jgi:hypothetical protein